MVKYMFGKEILDNLKEIINPTWTALIVVDVQNFDCSPNCLIAKEKIQNNLIMVEQVKKLLSKSREKSVFTVFLQNTFLPDGKLNSGADLLRRLKLWGNACLPTIKGTWEHQIVDSLKPKDNEIILPKSRQSGFFSTPLNSILRANRIRSLIITGTATEGCVESTVRDALALDYYVVVPKDCVSSKNKELHICSLRIMERLVHFVTDSQAIIELWEDADIEKTL